MKREVKAVKGRKTLRDSKRGEVAEQRKGEEARKGGKEMRMEEVVQLSPGAFTISAVQFSRHKTTLH